VRAADVLRLCDLSPQKVLCEYFCKTNKSMLECSVRAFLFYKFNHLPTMTFFLQKSTQLLSSSHCPVTNSWSFIKWCHATWYTFCCGDLSYLFNNDFSFSTPFSAKRTNWQYVHWNQLQILKKIVSNREVEHLTLSEELVHYVTDICYCWIFCSNLNTATFHNTLWEN